MEPLTPEEVARTLELIAESDVCENNTMLQSVLLIASGCIKELLEIKKSQKSL